MADGVLPKRSKQSNAAAAAVDSEASLTVPAIVAFLATTSWGKDDPRKPGSLLVCAEEGRWKCWINDRDGRRSAWVSAGSLLELLTSVEAGLLDDTLGWRSDGGGRK